MPSLPILFRVQPPNPSSFATESQHLYSQATAFLLEDAMGCRNEKPTTYWGTITAGTIVAA